MKVICTNCGLIIDQDLFFDNRSSVHLEEDMKEPKYLPFQIKKLEWRKNLYHWLHLFQVDKFQNGFSRHFSSLKGLMTFFDLNYLEKKNIEKQFSRIYKQTDIANSYTLISTLIYITLRNKQTNALSLVTEIFKNQGHRCTPQIINKCMKRHNLYTALKLPYDRFLVSLHKEADLFKVPSQMIAVILETNQSRIKKMLGIGNRPSGIIGAILYYCLRGEMTQERISHQLHISEIVLRKQFRTLFSLKNSTSIETMTLL